MSAFQELVEILSGVENLGVAHEVLLAQGKRVKIVSSEELEVQDDWSLYLWPNDSISLEGPDEEGRYISSFVYGGSF